MKDKPEARKAGGVYYTPGYIVEYIVRHAVDRFLQGKKPRQVARLRVLDPACGAGSFLIGAYQHLLDWHRDWYVSDDPQRHARCRKPRLRRGPAGDWLLTAAERKRILLNGIYGVDIDSQAVEAAKLSLLTKALEGELQGALSSRLPLLHERALRDLAGNIKCGNSLLGPDLYEIRQVDLPDEDEACRVDGFNWEAEFGDICTGRSAGFDAVIGNPPYRRELGYKHLLDEIAATDFGRKYRSPRMDLWYYFVHRGLDLLRPHGILSFIVSAYWTAGTGARKLITTLRDAAHVEEIFFLGGQKVFSEVAAQHMVIRVVNTRSDQATRVKLVRPGPETSAEPFVAGRSPVLVFDKTPKQLFQGNKVDLQPPSDDVLSKLDRWDPLGRLGIVRQGIAENPASINRKTNRKHGNRWRVGEGVFALRREEAESLELPDSQRELLRPYYGLRDLGRYSLSAGPSLVLIYSTRVTCPDINAYPRIKKHLSRFQVIMQDRRETRKGANCWWHLHWPRDERLWKSSKILSVQMASRPSFVPAWHPVYVPFSVNVFVPADTTRERLDYVCGLLNSRLMWKWYQHHAKRRGVGLEINVNVLARTPIRRIDFSDRADKARHERMAALVGRMLSLHKQLESAATAHRKTLIQRRIDAVDRQLDRLVYELYELTDEEIAIVEEATRS